MVACRGWKEKEKQGNRGERDGGRLREAMVGSTTRNGQHWHGALSSEDGVAVCGAKGEIKRKREGGKEKRWTAVQYGPDNKYSALAKTEGLCVERTDR